MLSYDLAENAILFECRDRLDPEMCGQPFAQGTLREMIALAITWHDCRFDGAKIVTKSDRKYRACAIEDIHWDEFENE